MSFEAHLKTCRDCQEVVEASRQIVELLPLASEQMEVPSGMKSRILTRVLASEIESEIAKQAESESPAMVRGNLITPSKQEGAIPMRGNRSWRYASLGLAAAVIGLTLYTGQLRQDVNQLQQQIAISTGPVQGLKVNEAVTLNPATKDIVAKGLATIVVDKSGTHLVVQAENLPELKGTEAYQVWLIKGENTFNAGTFLSQDGNGALYYSFNPQNYDAVAITLEPDAVGENPRGKIVLAAPIKRG
ncbi:anti-sigma factor [Paenibacillus qinlingensis]|nr:anti-sigma factor [Paenibacillus qinlingensis]